ncbi:MAG: hypothetical protein KatS3mg109_2349 [Pirellulaceae bacterium]|nr:MAG: hypothetical protein KatS3mg109_2349 [Pirellulaceae bacterium]
MRVRACHLVTLLGVLLATARAFAGQESDSHGMIETIVARWISRQETIRTIQARATADSFFGKGSVTARSESRMRSKYGTIPLDDVWFRNQNYSWAIDFAAGRFRKQFHAAFVYNRDIGGLPPEIRLFHETILFSGGKHTWVIRPEEWDYPGRPPVFKRHVSFDHGIGHAFVIWPEDLPLLWCAGGTITGDWPNPMQLLKVDGAEQFTWYGATDWHGRRCVVLRVRNQQSTDSVVEFWVDRDPPHAIYRSQIIRFVAQGERIERQIDVEYKKDMELMVPSKWQLASYYVGDSSAVTIKTFTIQDIQINRPLPEDLFTVRLEPGMGVSDNDNQRDYVVDLDGKLVPYQNPEQQQRIAAHARQQRTVRIAAPVVGVMALTVAAWIFYRYLRRTRKMNP